MKAAAGWSAVMACATLWAVQAQAQTADEIIEKHLAAEGGRSAMAKLESRIAKGTIALSVQGTDISGPIEIYNKAPNKARTYFKLDLSSFGAPDVVVDQRCDGKTAFMSHSMQGDRDITGSQLQSMLNASFPSPLLNYKAAGARVELTGKEKIGDREAYVVVYTPKAGLPSTQYFDTQTYLIVRAVTKVDAPELGGVTEQTSDISDYREVDGVQVPFALHVTNAAQEFTITLASVEHNKPIDDAMFSRPAVK
jgi:outer membrane lipoprotein-sorting protein